MKVIMEMFVSIMLILIACVLFSSIINSFIAVNNARNYHSQIIECLENSNYDEQVLKMLYEDAVGRGYGLTMKECVTKTGDVSYFVSLIYEIRFPIFELFHNPLSKEGVIEGYASV